MVPLDREDDVLEGALFGLVVLCAGFVGATLVGSLVVEPLFASTPWALGHLMLARVLVLVLVVTGAASGAALLSAAMGAGPARGALVALASMIAMGATFSLGLPSAVPFVGVVVAMLVGAALPRSTPPARAR